MHSNHKQALIYREFWIKWLPKPINLKYLIWHGAIDQLPTSIVNQTDTHLPLCVSPNSQDASWRSQSRFWRQSGGACWGWSSAPWSWCLHAHSAKKWPPPRPGSAQPGARSSALYHPPTCIGTQMRPIERPQPQEWWTRPEQGMGWAQQGNLKGGFQTDSIWYTKFVYIINSGGGLYARVWGNEEVSVITYWW